MSTPDFISSFREAAPYIDYLRGKTLVIGLASSLLSEQVLPKIAADLNLLTSLGVKIVLVHGLAYQINQLSVAQNIYPQFHHHHRITDEATIRIAKQAAGIARADIEAALSIGITQTLQRSRRQKIQTGNFISAQPYGIIDGIDMGYTGRVRKIDSEAIRQNLDNGSIVIISPIASSLSGKIFSLSMTEIAQALAIALQAEKLIFLIEQAGILSPNDKLIKNLSAAQAQIMLNNKLVHSDQVLILEAALNAVKNKVQRSQIISGRQDGSLLSELFTRDGIGTSLSCDAFIKIRQATSYDIADIMALIRPLEEAGILLKRNREYLENHINGFYLLEHDRQLYGCVAFKEYPEDNAAELACLVVSPHTRDAGYGEYLLEHIIKESKKRGYSRLFALTTHTSDWFSERGFKNVDAQELPAKRQHEYQESKRQSKVFLLQIKANSS